MPHSLTPPVSFQKWFPLLTLNYLSNIGQPRIPQRFLHPQLADITNVEDPDTADTNAVAD